MHAWRRDSASDRIPNPAPTCAAPGPICLEGGRLAPPGLRRARLRAASFLPSRCSVACQPSSQTRAGIEALATRPWNYPPPPPPAGARPMCGAPRHPVLRSLVPAMIGEAACSVSLVDSPIAGLAEAVAPHMLLYLLLSGPLSWPVATPPHARTATQTRTTATPQRRNTAPTSHPPARILLAARSQIFFGLGGIINPFPAVVMYT